MFKTCIIKNYKRKESKRIAEKDIDECSKERPDERSLPYFEVVPEQVLSDRRYLSLIPQQQGQFLRFIIHVAAPNNGMVVRQSGMISKKLSMERSEWDELEAVLLKAGLLITVQDGDYLIQHELREQYLQTLEANNAKRR